MKGCRPSAVRSPSQSVRCAILILHHAETPASERPQLFIKKLHQCAVVFDFNDANAELKGKQIKTQTLHEMLEYITTQRGVITENVYPEVVKMVRNHLPRERRVPMSASLPRTSSALYPLPSTLPEMPSTLKRTNLSLNLLGRTSRLFTNSSCASSRALTSTPTSPSAISIRPSS